MEELMAKYLANELSEEERTEFEKQLVDSDELKVELQDYLNLWTENGPVTDMSFDRSKAWGAVSKEIAPQSRVVQMEHKPKYTFLKIAATLLIVLTAGYFISQSINDRETASVNASTLSEVSTGAEMKEVALPDGSVVKLNANSKLSYQEGFGKTHRNIALAGGANFDVERNENLPFVIEASKGQVEVLGTSFDVKAYAGKEVELNVTEGRVKFSSMTKETAAEVLNAGEKAKLSADGESIEKGVMSDQNYAAWWTRELNFENTPIPEVVKILEETYWVEIEFSETLKNCPLTSSYKDKTLDEVLNLLEGSFAANQLKAVRTKENKIKLEGKACTN